MSLPHKRLAIVIVNYRTPDMVVDCLVSIENEIRHDDIVIVVDNASGDGSADKIDAAIAERKWELWVRLVRAPENGGFSYGNNIGIREVEADAYFLLNSDTLVKPGSIHSLMEALESNPDVGLIGPRLEFEDGTTQTSCFRNASPLSEIIRSANLGLVTSILNSFNIPLPISENAIRPDWISFAAVLIRSQVIKDIGIMDHGYFMYFEDIDFCRRARKAGWDILHWPESRIVHLHGQSSPVASLMTAQKRQPRYYYEARSRYYGKFYGIFGFWCVNLLWTAGRFLSLLREIFGGRKAYICEKEWIDIWTNCMNPVKAVSCTDGKESP